MQFIFKGFEIDIVDILVFAAPLLAALYLTYLVAIQPKIVMNTCLHENRQFIAMPRNSYLKIP